MHAVFILRSVAMAAQFHYSVSLYLWQITTLSYQTLTNCVRRIIHAGLIKEGDIIIGPGIESVFLHV